MVDVLIAEHLNDTIGRHEYARDEAVIETFKALISNHVSNNSLNDHSVLYKC